MSIRERRPRRTNQELEKDILLATREEIIEKGFAGLTVIGISKRAGIEPSVFYKRYKDLNRLLERYVQEYDYWYSAMFTSFNKVSPADYEAYLKDVFISMNNVLQKDKSMQELILWELTEDNEITHNTNRMREIHTEHIVDTLEKYFTDKGIRTNFRAFSAIILSAIYFLAIHRGEASFCGINFKDPKGQTLLIECINDIIPKVLEQKEPHNEIISVAKKMKANHIDTAVIAECTGLDKYVIINL